PLPGWVQLWEPPAEKADMLLLIARPGNEWRFMGGILPEYAVERGMNVLTVFMTCANQTLMSEMLNSLWFSGYRNYPLLGGFPDSKESSVTKLYKVWDTTAVRRFVMEVVRKYQPEVIVTHDISKGENDNAVNKVCAEMAAFCFGNADNPAIEPYLYELYGGWQPKKLYIHLYGQNSVKMDWRIPLNRLHGQTAIETAQEAFKLYASQKSLKITISDADSFKFSNALFGLYATRVGPDNHRNDLMENIPGLGVITFVPPDDVLHADTNQNRSPALNADWYAGAGKRNEKGFLEAGEFILENDAAGLWFYASPTLIVRIDRMRNTTAKKTWYEAHMYVDLESRERIGSVLYVPEVSGRTHTQITRIAKENHVVFGLSTDYYTYRTGVKDATVGVVIRGGRILHDSAPARNRSKFPNLDTLAMFGDGNWGVYYSDEYTAADYLAMGAVDVFSFGPILVRDGMINPFIDEMYGGKTGQPRCALGMIEAGHYYAMLEEGRFKKDAVGTSLKDLAIHMHQKGCRLALNLDGGQTAVYTFMGKQITRIAVYQPNGYDLPRATSELIAAGFSASVDP
ncbi:MAG: phosphodiester glycosidase family protein, partial [Clostridia bacterium]|nr:phosphodiester glycosidase family protein [Clostridia bacterium]